MAMSKNPYERFRNDDLILRDELAIDRTVLANERTVLAYVRTALAFAIARAGAIKFLDSTAALAAGWCLIAAGVGSAGYGGWRYRDIARRIAASRRPGG